MKTPFWPVPLGSKPIDLGLERVVEALEKMGKPHLKLPPVIHIAGTNGKGSTLAFLRAILEEEGYKCHIYTSPHLVEFNERIVVAGEKISDEFLTEVLEETKNMSQGTALTFFEGTTLAAIFAFSKVKADFVLLETGMGGRLDATNIIDNPLLTIITPISLDHTEFLGDTLAKIAYEKACIMKKGAPCVVAPQVDEVMEVLKNYADKVGCQLSVVSRQLSVISKPSLVGKHQYMNVAVAVRCVQELRNKGYKISDEAIEKGVSSAKWLARLQDVSDVFGMETYLDGSHNPQGAETISEFLAEKNIEEEKGNEVANYLIIGMLKNKDVEGFLKNLNPEESNVKKIFFIEIPDEPNSAKPEELKAVADKIFGNNIDINTLNTPDSQAVTPHSLRGRSEFLKLPSTPQQVRGDISSVETEVAENLDDALSKISAIQESGKQENKTQNSEQKIFEQKNKRIIICGSLYLAGWVLENYIK